MQSNSIIKTRFSRKQHTDAGMALVLLLLLVGYFTGNVFFYNISIILLFLTMAIPGIIYPFTVFWFTLSAMLGEVMSKVILTLLYIIFVVPMGFIRKIAGKDTLKIRHFHRKYDSVFSTRNKLFLKKDLDNSY
jgi:hypothetical membrane protein